MPLAETFQPGTFVDALRFIGDNPGLIWDRTVEQLALSAVALGVAVAIALPLGVMLGHLHRGSFVAVNVGNLGRALPSIALIAFGIPIFGPSTTNVAIALVVLAVPVILANAYVAVDGVEPDAVEAARGMGMTGSQILRRVELPLAVPLLFAGLRTAAVYVVATATLGAFSAAGTLGEIIVNQASYRLAGVVGAALCVTALAVAVDVALAGLQRLVTPRPLRGRAATDVVIAEPPVTRALA